MERLPVVSKCYDHWLMLQGRVDSYYHDNPQERIPLSQQKEFRQIKNAVIQEAERLHLGEIDFEEKGLNQQDEPEEYRNASYDYWALRDVIRDESLTMEERSDAVSEMGKLAENGDMYAQYLMGKLWRDGPLLIPDSVNARYWLEQAAEQGHLIAQYSLAKLYLIGKEVPYDEEQAVHWLSQSAKQDNQYAQHLLNHLEENRPPSAMLAVTRLLHHMSRIFRDNSVPKSRPGGIQVDRKRLKKLQEKRIAMGHKPDDHEQQWPDLIM